MQRLAPVLFLSAVVACAAGDPASPAHDAGDGAADAPPAERSCTAAASYGTATLADQEASGEGSDAERYNLEARGRLDDDAAPDVLTILLYNNEGSFGEILSTGVFPLAGQESDFATCGACVLLDTNTQPGTVTDVYMPDSGQLEILEVGDRFRAVLENATLRHVLIDVTTFETTNHADACTSFIERAEFDVVIGTGA